MPRADFLQLPVHARGLLVKNLHPIHPHIAFTRIGIFRDDARQRDEPPAILRPALLDRQIQQRRQCGLRVRRMAIEPVHNFLARASFDDTRFRVPQVQRGAEQFHRFPKSGRRFCLHERAQLRGDRLDRFRAQAHRHAQLRTHRIDRERKRRYLPVHGRAIE